ncbi:MAG: ABC transporter permease [Hyphomicrobium sp.]|nr:ABC transporter permease [Hyphomicrobium sp.]
MADRSGPAADAPKAGSASIATPQSAEIQHTNEGALASATVPASGAYPGEAPRASAVTRAQAASDEETPLQLFWINFSQSWLAVFGLAVFCLIILAAIFAPWLSPQKPYDLAQLNILESRLPPGSLSSEGHVHWLGTDDQGRDLYSAILYGLRISLGVGVGSAFIALIIGCTLGLIAAYAGGRTDSAVMRIVDLQLSFPSILVALMILAFLGKGVMNVLLALVIVEWAYYARVVRATALVERDREYMEAAASLALPRWRIIFRHLLPNCVPPMIVIATQQVARAIALEATLSYLGLGVPITEPSLGLLIANGYQYMLSGRYWVSVYPGVALLVTIIALNLVGDQLRDVLNPRHLK